MKEYLKNLWTKFKEKSVLFKTFICFIIILYFGLIAICVIPVKTDSTVPGTISNVSRFISIGGDSNKNKTGNIYTVSVYSQPKMSVLQYLFVKMDRNSEIFLGESITYDIFTENEDYTSNAGYKYQSIQDSLIVAYTKAKSEGYDVSLDYSYKGEYLIHIPQNLFQTGAEDFKNADVVTKYNDKTITCEEDYLQALDEIFSGVMYNGTSIKELKDNHKFDIHDKDGNKIDENIKLIKEVLDFVKDQKVDVNFTVKRKVEKNNDIKEEEKIVTPSLKMLFYLYTNKLAKVEDDQITAYSVKDNHFTCYDIKYDKCNPKINISKTQTVGPSGGLMQALAVYNAITTEDVTKGWRVMGTGGINLDGEATPIGGEQQKVVTADLFSADLFFIPEENYESAKEMHEKKNLKFHLISVKTLDDVIAYLNGLEAKK